MSWSGVATNLSIDDGLLVRAETLGNHRTKREAVEHAPREYVERLDVSGPGDGSPAEMVGSIESDPDRSPRRIRGNTGP